LELRVTAKKPPKLYEKRGHVTVTLTGRVTKVRTEYWLGPWDEPATREAIVSCDPHATPPRVA
jgi:hypothetical protein